MEYNKSTFDKVINYYINQVFKMLGLFEDKNKHGYKHAIKILSELEQLPEQYPHLQDEYKYKIILIKVGVIADELFFLDGDHQFVKNHVMESLKILDEIKEG